LLEYKEDRLVEKHCTCSKCEILGDRRLFITEFVVLLAETISYSHEYNPKMISLEIGLVF
jgi:hypothetical protein